MDFKSLISKLDSMDAPPQTPAAPTLPNAVRLDEDIAMHVLAGTKTLAEAASLMEKKLTAAEKEKKEEVVKSMKKDKSDFKERYGKRGEEVMHATATKIAKKKAESVESSAADKEISEVFSDSDPVGSKKKTQHGVATKTEKGLRHERGASDTSDDDDDWDDEPKSKKKAKKESIDPEAFKSKFLKMVEAAKKEEKKVKGKKAEEKMDEAKKPDEDGDGVPDWADKKPGEDDNAGKKKSGKKGMTAKQEKYFGKKKSVKESFFESEEEGVEDLMAAVEEEIRQPGRHIDNLQDVMNATFDADESSEFERARAIINRYLELVTNTDVDHHDNNDPDYDPEEDEPMIRRMRHGNLARHIAEYDLTDYLVAANDMLKRLNRMGESTKMKGKKVVKESFEQKLTFREMVKLVHESGGQQAIDPLDKDLFAWATRVAANKLGEGTKAEVYAGLVYERMGGRFEMYDVLSENKK